MSIQAEYLPQVSYNLITKNKEVVGYFCYLRAPPPRNSFAAEFSDMKVILGVLLGKHEVPFSLAEGSSLPRRLHHSEDCFQTLLPITIGDVVFSASLHVLR